MKVGKPISEVASYKMAFEFKDLKSAQVELESQKLEKAVAYSKLQDYL